LILFFAALVQAFLGIGQKGRNSASFDR